MTPALLFACFLLRAAKQRFTLTCSHHVWLCLPLQGASSFYRQRREEADHASSNDADHNDPYKLHTLVTPLAFNCSLKIRSAVPIEVRLLL